jgi:hypothetical protein
MVTKLLCSIIHTEEDLARVDGLNKAVMMRESWYSTSSHAAEVVGHISHLSWSWRLAMLASSAYSIL